MITAGFHSAAVLGSIWDFPLFPPRASTNAESVDIIYVSLIVLSVLISALVCWLVIYFAVKYRAGSKADRTNPIVKTSRLEITWTAATFVVALALFGWADRLYFIEHSPPADTLDIYVVGKQWMWKMQHPGGRREINELHVPQNRAVKLIMTSQDVVHSMFIPAFRVKQDVLPSGYTSLWFEATTVGEYHLFCSQYCGADHARMIGRVVVMSAHDYQQWLAVGNIGVSGAMASAGGGPFTALGCANCHVAGSNTRAPDLTGLFGKRVYLQDGRTITADEEYIRESILDPQAKITAGYPPVMPTYKGQIDAQQLGELIEYIKSLGPLPPAGGREGDSSNTRGSSTPLPASPRGEGEEIHSPVPAPPKPTPPENAP